MKKKFLFCAFIFVSVIFIYNIILQYFPLPVNNNTECYQIVITLHIALQSRSKRVLDIKTAAVISSFFVSFKTDDFTAALCILFFV